MNKFFNFKVLSRLTILENINLICQSIDRLLCVMDCSKGTYKYTLN